MSIRMPGGFSFYLVMAGTYLLIGYGSLLAIFFLGHLYPPLGFAAFFLLLFSYVPLSRHASSVIIKVCKIRHPEEGDDDDWPGSDPL